ncbi:hypothetical protein D8Z77_20335 [Brevibacillus laterosporus]|nr:hypothetical protein D8Z77_20335 [Brevibacillus laterosporus]
MYKCMTKWLLPRDHGKKLLLILQFNESDSHFHFYDYSPLASIMTMDKLKDFFVQKESSSFQQKKDSIVHTIKPFTVYILLTDH